MPEGKFPVSGSKFLFFLFNRIFLAFLRRFNFKITFLGFSVDVKRWRRYHCCTTSFNKAWTQVLHRFNPARGVSQIRDGEDLWLWSRLEIRLIQAYRGVNFFQNAEYFGLQFIILDTRGNTWNFQIFSLGILLICKTFAIKIDKPIW